MSRSIRVPKVLAASSRPLATHAPIPTFEGSTAKPFLLEDALPAVRDTLPMFTLSRERGFLPRADPLAVLPEQFAPLESLLDRMTINQPNGSVGLLGVGQFGDAVRAELSDGQMEKMVDKVIANSNDPNLLSALFRDYCFLTSSYLLEPTDLSFRKTGQYAPGRNHLAKELARPLSKLAEKLGHYPFMEYASSYALQNYKRIHQSKESLANPASRGPIREWDYSNLGLIRAFYDHQGSEAGFILTHIAMVAYTGHLVAMTEDILTAANAKDRKTFKSNMKSLYEVYTKINVTMDTMWNASKPGDYLKFRSFIFGTGPAKMNAMFPDGVIYEGVSDEPMAFRGESGANDSIIPVLDNLLQVTGNLPKNEFTETLRDFRKYRPSSQREYLAGLEHRAVEANVAAFAHEDVESLGWYVLLLDQNREFRERHWRFTKEYIIKRSDYGLATGGSPILKYLPNNLSVVHQLLTRSFAQLPASSVATLPEDFANKIEVARAKAIQGEAILNREIGDIANRGRGAMGPVDTETTAPALEQRL